MDVYKHATLAGFSRTPFLLPGRFHSKLGTPQSDGNWYLDVKAKGKWEGIIVVNGDGVVIGIYAGHTISPWNLPFLPEEMEDVRTASIKNRLLAAVPDAVWFWLPPVSLAIGCGVMGAGHFLLAAAITAVGMIPIVTWPRAHCIMGCPIAVALAGVVIGSTMLALQSWLR